MGFEGAEAQPIPAVGLRSFGLRDREDRPRSAFTHLATLRWPMVGIMPAFLLLQTFAEGALEVLWGAGRRLAPIAAALILVGFYVAWFAQL